MSFVSRTGFGCAPGNGALSARMIAWGRRAFASWTAGEIAREAAWEALNAIDHRQTLQTARNPDRFRELNPILGEHPDERAVDLYFTIWMLLHPMITHALPREKTLLGTRTRPRALWQHLSLAVSGYCVVNNLRLGLDGGSG